MTHASPRRLTLPALVGATILILLLAACSAGGGTSWSFSPPVPTEPAASGSPSPGGEPSPDGTPGGNVIELELTADLQITQGGQKATEIAVKQGETYTFRVTNTAGFVHNFWIGTDQQLESNATGGMTGVPEFPSGTQEFEFTFDAADALSFGCTVPGHLSLMRGTFAIEP